MDKFAHSAQASSQLPLGPSYSMTFGFEENFDVPKSIQFFHDYTHVPFIMSLGVYLSVLYFGQKIMANRAPIKAEKALVLWNFSLALFSLIGFARLFPEFFHTLRNFGFEHSVCNNSYFKVKPAAFWTYLFMLSKIPELIDTLFLVLRKQKLIFLHVYHHATVPFIVWYMYADQMAAVRWFCTMNFGVHAIMYTYFALKALPNRIWIPKWIAMLITTSQVLQMAIGTCVSACVGYIQLTGRPCDTTTRASIISLLCYISQLILFSRFFYMAYCCPAPPRPARDDKKRA